MLRAKRIGQLQIALCLWAFMSAYLSLVIFRVLERVALPVSVNNLARAISDNQDIETVRTVCVQVLDASSELRDNGIFLAYWGLGFALLWSCILGITAVFHHRQLRRSHLPHQQAESENVVDLALMGKLELWKAFWGFFVGLTFASALVIYGAGSLLLKSGALESFRQVTLVVFPIVGAVPMTLVCVSALAAWRCAPNTSRVVWRVLARTTIATWASYSLIKSLSASWLVFAV